MCGGMTAHLDWARASAASASMQRDMYASSSKTWFISLLLLFFYFLGGYFADLVCAEERTEDAGVDGADGADAASGDACGACDAQWARGTRELCEEGHCD